MVKKYIITGGPGSGKTSIILALNILGESIIRECAEDFIRVQQANGIENPQALDDFQRNLLEIQIARELEAEKLSVERVFLDGAVPDFFAYSEICGQKHPEDRIRDFLKDHPYEKTTFFVLPVKKYKRTEVRRESFGKAIEIGERLMGYYEQGGYILVKVPEADLNLRVNQILSELER